MFVITRLSGNFIVKEKKKTKKKENKKQNRNI